MAARVCNDSQLFQHYWDKYFKFPKDIRNDLVYCQRALKEHLKVHQMVLDVFLQQADADPEYKQRILEELESEIFEINAEQQFQFLRLRRHINEFYKILRKNSIPPNVMATNAFISSEMVSLIINETSSIKPKNVSVRQSEEHLIARFFEVQQPVDIYEVSDSDDDVILPDVEKPAQVMNSRNDMEYSDVESNTSNQKSLLKPMAQRMGKNYNEYAEVYTEFVQASMSTVVSKPTSNLGSPKVLEKPQRPGKSKSGAANATPPTAELRESKKVKMSRLNLRQALKKAHTETMAAKAAANNQISRKAAAPLPVAKPQAETKSVSNKTQSSAKQAAAILVTAAKVVPAPVPAPKREVKVGKRRNTVAAAKAPELNHSSEDSNPERDAVPVTATAVCVEDVDRRIGAAEFNQEMFLRIFNLYTPEVLVQMQQRRSKRKRRNVHNNERDDFHYGRFESTEKKRRGFLLSPQVKRVLQSKRPKRVSADKNQEVLTSRSNSSSPDEKRCCNSCLKVTGGMEQCVECKGYYHEACHREEDEVVKNGRTTSAVAASEAKLCPACKRAHVQVLKAGVKQYQELQETAQELNSKMTKERNRRATLQKESKLYKTQMSQLFKIVKTIKTDQVILSCEVV